MSTRRDFIKTGCVHCAGLLGVGMLLQSCGSSMHIFKTAVKDNRITVPASEFADGKNMMVVRNSSLENDILLVKKNDQYSALNLRCTHEGFGLTTTSKRIVCSAHGSTFDFDGNVLKEPALKPLKKFNTQIINNTIIIELV
ncbi:MAG: Rieske (2Fe-2S) protein [Agriterribacter sp.]